MAAIDQSAPSAALCRRTFADRARVRLVSAPAWAWLVLIVGASAAMQARLALGMPAPRVFGDELIYWDLARSFAATGHFALRGTPDLSYGIGYPLLVAPVLAVFKSLPAAYAAVKVVNALLMSLAAVPAFLIARKVVRRDRALIAAALAVLVPSMVYTGTIMTENAFYPAFLTCVWLTLRALESPTAARQLAVLGMLGVAFLIRAEAVALLPAYVSAVVALAAIDAEKRGRTKHVVGLFRTYRVTWATLGGVLAVAAAVEAARGRTPLGLLGAYGASRSNLTLAAIPKWFLYHVADLDLYLGFVPFAAAIAVVPLALRARSSSQLRIFLVAAGSFAVWMTLLVAAFSTVPKALDQLHERNLFYLVPLFLIAFLCWLEDEERTFPLVGAAIAALLPVTLPFAKLVPTAGTDALALVPWAQLPWRAVPFLFGVVGFAAVAFAYGVRRRSAPLLIGLVVLSFAVVGANAASQAHAISDDLGPTGGSRDWIDRAVPAGTAVTEIWFPAAVACGPGSSLIRSEAGFWRNEFFNRAIGSAYFIGSGPADNLPATRLALDRRGVMNRGDGRAFAPGYVVVADSVRLEGRVVARDAKTKTTLYRTSGVVRLAGRPSCRSIGGRA